jgi:hypothetical protein
VDIEVGLFEQFLAGRLNRLLDGKIPQGVRAKEIPHFFDRSVGGDQVLGDGGIDSIVTGKAVRRTGGAKMNLAGARVAQGFDNLPTGVASNDRVVDDHHPLVLQHARRGGEFQFQRRDPLFLHRLNKRPSDVMIADKAEGELDARGVRIAQGGEVPRIGNRHHQIRLRGVVLSQQLAAAVAEAMNGRL